MEYSIKYNRCWEDKEGKEFPVMVKFTVTGTDRVPSMRIFKGDAVDITNGESSEEVYYFHSLSKAKKFVMEMKKKIKNAIQEWSDCFPMEDEMPEDEYLSV